MTTRHWPIALGFAAIALTASLGSAQVIYEPVVTQYGGQSPYYYAGNDPAIHQAALFPSAPGATWGRIPGYAFVGPTREVVQRNYRAYTDAFGTVDAKPYGLTPDQVQNEANARLPRFFTKRDLLAAAKTTITPQRVMFTVPPDATAMDRVTPRGTMTIRPTTPGLHNRYPIFSFPKSMLDRKIDDVAGGKSQA